MLHQGPLKFLCLIGKSISLKWLYMITNSDTVEKVWFNTKSNLRIKWFQITCGLIQTDDVFCIFKLAKKIDWFVDKSIFAQHLCFRVQDKMIHYPPCAHFECKYVLKCMAYIIECAGLTYDIRNEIRFDFTNI